MDFSDYPKSFPNYDSSKKGLGKFKDKFFRNKWPISYVGLKPKSNAFKVQGDKNGYKKSRGVVKGKVNTG